jgi:hypothetical protein
MSVSRLAKTSRSSAGVFRGLRKPLAVQRECFAACGKVFLKLFDDFSLKIYCPEKIL